MGLPAGLLPRNIPVPGNRFHSTCLPGSGSLGAGPAGVLTCSGQLCHGSRASLPGRLSIT